MHISVCLYGGSLVSYATNKNDKHSETRAIKKANGAKIDTIINLRIKRKSGKIGLSYPCMNCYSAIAQAGVKNLIFSNESGKFESEIITTFAMIHAVLKPEPRSNAIIADIQ